jgi:hypothetical protein
MTTEPRHVLFDSHPRIRFILPTEEGLRSVRVRDHPARTHRPAKRQALDILGLPHRAYMQQR